MVYLSIENLAKAFLANHYQQGHLFKNLSIGLNKGEKIGLVGKNGVGKSTLLKIIAGEVEADVGQVILKNNITLGYAEQSPEFLENDTLFSALYQAENPAMQAVREYELTINLSETNNDILSKAIAKMDQFNAWDYESTIKQILGKLGLQDLNKRVSELSGGQKKRAALAKALIEKPDLLILDEPTNHLDIGMIEWLENYLDNQNMSLLLVTHDRYFLEKVTNTIWELADGKVYKHEGNYNDYLENKSLRAEQEAVTVQKARNLYKKELDWMRRQPKARGTKAKYRVENFKETEATAQINLDKHEMMLDLKTQRQGNKILELHHIHQSFQNKKLINDFSYTFKKKDRIGIIGKNGTGKSTLLNILTQTLKPDSGTVIIGETTQIGYYTQDPLFFKPNQRMIENIREIAEVVELNDGSTIGMSQLLERFLFPASMHYAPIEHLSGGEKRRLQLLHVLLKQPNFLILDEPTNDLDLDTLNVLDDFLELFKGCLVIVSHDRYFMDRLVNQLIVFGDANGKLRMISGNYADYQEIIKNESKESVVPSNHSKEINPQQPKSIANNSRKAGFNEKKEWKELENLIPKLEAERVDLEERIKSESNYEQLIKLGIALEEINLKIEEKTARWFELDEMINA